MLDRRKFIGTVVTGSLASVSAATFGTQVAFGETAIESIDGTVEEYVPPGVVSDVGIIEPAGNSTRPAIEPYAEPSVTYEAARDGVPKRLLVVVDYQNDFVSGGPFGDIPTAKAIEQALAEKVQEYYDAGDIVIYTMDTHPDDNYFDTREGQVNPPHCIPGTAGWEIHGTLRDLLTPKRAIRVLKGTYGSADLPFVVKNIMDQGTSLEYIEFAGVSTTCRVLHNAILLYNFFPALPMVFDEATTASYSDEQTAAQLDQLEGWGFIIKRR